MTKKSIIARKFRRMKLDPVHNEGHYLMVDCVREISVRHYNLSTMGPTVKWRFRHGVRTLAWRYTRKGIRNYPDKAFKTEAEWRRRTDEIHSKTKERNAIRAAKYRRRHGLPV